MYFDKNSLLIWSYNIYLVKIDLVFDPFVTNIILFRGRWTWNHGSQKMWCNFIENLALLCSNQAFSSGCFGKMKNGGRTTSLLISQKNDFTIHTICVCNALKGTNAHNNALSQCISARALSGASAVRCGIGWCWFEYNGAVSLRSFRSGS